MARINIREMAVNVHLLTSRSYRRVHFWNINPLRMCMYSDVKVINGDEIRIKGLRFKVAGPVSGPTVTIPSKAPYKEFGKYYSEMKIVPVADRREVA